jgi:hypothetical protein
MKRILACVGAIALSSAALAVAPDIQLNVQWRWVPLTAAATTGTGSVSWGTALPATGAVVTRSAPIAEPVVQRVQARNGEEARVGLTTAREETTLDWVWTAQGQGLQTRTRWRPAQQSLWVRPEWPGGNASVRLAYRIDAARPDPAALASHQQVLLEGQVSLPWDSWVEIGRWSAADGSGERLELRVGH